MPENDLTLKPCPVCGVPPHMGYACGEYFIQGENPDCPICGTAFTEMHTNEALEAEAWNGRAEYDRHYLGKPTPLADCTGCAHFIRWKYLAGKIPCGNPAVKTILPGRPCYVPKGKRMEEKPWLD